ncbi:MAG: hypothetical protein IH627_05660 [Rubrivivax sp.]|nr:hypothetical protein [Rubrivivax sp.]
MGRINSPRGKVSLGQGDGAADGGMEVDLSGTTVITYSGITDIGGGFAFRQGAALGPTIGSTTSNLALPSQAHVWFGWSPGRWAA